MVRFFFLSKRDHPYFAELDFHSCSPAPCFASQSTNSFQIFSVDPRAAEISSAVGCAVLPMKALVVFKSLLSITLLTFRLIR
jgi:hypothetical protein